VSGCVERESHGSVLELNRVRKWKAERSYGYINALKGICIFMRIEK